MVGICVGAAGQTPKYLVGLSDEPLVPTFSTRSARYPAADIQLGAYPVDGLGLSLRVRAAYIAKPGNVDGIVLVAADMISLCPADAEAARNAPYNGAPGLMRDRILINISHTHTAPQSCDTSVRAQIGEGELKTAAQPDSDWRRLIVQKLKDAIQHAIDARQEADLTFYRGKFHGGHNRRTGPPNGSGDMTDANGTTVVDPNGYDQTLDVVKITAADGVKGVLFFYGMHPSNMDVFPFPNTLGLPACNCPQNLGDCAGLFYHHPDYPGFARKRIEQSLAPNGKAIFFQAAGGDVNPGRFCAGYQGTRALGELLGDTVVQMMGGTGTPLSPGNPITAYDRVWAAPLQTAAGDYWLGGYPGEPKGTNSPAPGAGQSSTGNWFLWASQWCRDTTGHGGGNERCRPKPGAALETSFDMELQVLTIDQWRIAALSHEPVGIQGVRLRQKWPGYKVSVAGYANREQTYLPTSAQLDADATCWTNNNCAYPSSGPGRPPSPPSTGRRRARAGTSMPRRGASGTTVPTTRGRTSSRSTSARRARFTRSSSSARRTCIRRHQSPASP